MQAFKIYADKEMIASQRDLTGNTINIFEHALRVRWYRMLLQIHPDKHKENIEQYTTLTKDINSFYDKTKRSINILKSTRRQQKKPNPENNPQQNKPTFNRTYTQYNRRNPRDDD